MCEDAPSWTTKIAAAGRSPIPEHLTVSRREYEDWLRARRDALLMEVRWIEKRLGQQPH